jgi:hypothetical protein
LIAREPINRSAQRFIIREISSLTWIISSTERNDSRVDDYTAVWEEIWEDGDGFHIWLSRMLEDVCSLPFGAASEVGYKGQDLDWVQHVDGATLLPTYEKNAPYCQINPDNWTQRVYFRRDQLRRLRVNPRPDIRFKEYQVSPTEDGFTEIEALSKIYLYYMQELTDTVPLGILDVMDWDEEDAMNWARNFREMIEGTDPIKIPILYDHEGAAKFIQFGRSPQDMNVVEQFKRFAEVLLSKYGLSIGDLRLFEHESTKAGERVSQMVTERSGVGFWASAIRAFINRLLPDGLTFEFKQPRPERELVVANRKAAQLRMLQEAAGVKPLISVKDAVEEARALELFTTEVKPLDEPPPQPPPANGGPGGNLPQLPDDETDEERDQQDDADLSKALLDVRPFVERALGERWQHPEPPAVERLEALVRGAFVESGGLASIDVVGEILEEIEQALGPQEKGGPGSGNWGHAGRPGARGGSGPGGGLAAIGAKRGHTAYERRAISQRKRGAGYRG